MKLFSVFILGAVLTAASYGAKAGEDYGMAGCGLGAVWQGTGSPISAATTNDFTYSQLFGISSGTSNCDSEEHQLATRMQQEQFIVQNLNALQKEVAQGSGETLIAFTDVLGCRPESYQKVATHLQGSYSEIFSAPGAIAVLHASKQALKGNPQVQQACTGVI